jgi:transposase
VEIVVKRILFVLTEGCTWRAIDGWGAAWNSIYQYYRRWSKTALWEKVLAELGREVAGEFRFIDATHVKVHCDGANPAGGQENQAMGRTKGGLNTKIHAVVDSKGRAAAVLLSAGNDADVTVAPEAIELVGPGNYVADKAYDSNALRALIENIGGTACIPPKSNRVKPIAYSKHTYKKRHKVENFFQKIKRFRRVATRYDKLSETYLGFVLLAVLCVELSK